MSAGLPGLGLSGFFVMLCALVMPAFRKRSDRRRWLVLFGFAIVLIGVIVVAWMSMSEIAGRVAPHGKHSSGATFFGVPIIAASLAILAVILVVPEVLLRTIGTRPTPALPPVLHLGEHPER